LIELISKVVGSMDKVSVHASGILICQQPIYKLVPTYKIKDSIVCAFDMSMLEELNGLKLDCLILGTMSNIRDTLIQVHNYQK
jgi:DNA polymerase III alpha subunit